MISKRKKVPLLSRYNCSYIRGFKPILLYSRRG